MKAQRRNTFVARLRNDTSGSVFVEAAIVLPITCIILAGIAEWGLALYQFHVLSTATGNSVRQLIISRGYDTPFSDVMTEFTNWAGTLDVLPSQITVKVDGVKCDSDATCKTKLGLALAKPASVTVQYPCTMQFTPAIASPCPITISMTGLVE